MKHLVFSSLYAALILATSEFATAKTFVYCSEGSPTIFNPQLATDGPTFNASSQTIYNRLVDFKDATTEVEPALAKRWKISDDGLQYTFDLRQDVKFHKTDNFEPSRTLNADDVVFTFHRMLNEKHPYHKVSGGTYEYFESMNMSTLIQKVEKVDKFTVRFVLARPEAPFLATMAMDFASILSKEYGDQLQKAGTPAKIDREPVGTGPFVFDRYVKDTLIRYDKHPGYYEGATPLDRFIIAITPDPNVRFQKLKAGECHLIAEPAPNHISAMKKDANIRVMQQPGLNIGYLAMNVQKKPFDNSKVRRAVNHALNKEAYIEAIYLGHAKVAKNPIPPTMWSYNQEIEPYEYDPTKAKKLLKEAGYEDGFEVSLFTLPVSRPYNPNGKKMGELMQADLSKVGIKVQLVSYDWPTYLAKGRKGEHEMIQLGWTGDNGDPDNFLYVLLGCAAVEGGSNYARWCNQEFNQLLLKGKKTNSVSKRTEYYKKAQKIFHQQVPWVPIAHSTVFRALSKKVQGYQMSPFGTESFYGVDLKD